MPRMILMSLQETERLPRPWKDHLVLEALTGVGGKIAFLA